MTDLIAALIRSMVAVAASSNAGAVDIAAGTA